MKERKMMFLTLLLIILSPVVTPYEFCESTISEDELEILEITDLARIGETSWTWEPNEQIDVEVDVINKNFTTRNFQVELFFLDDNLRSKNIIIADTNPIQTISLTRDEITTLNFSFQVSEPNKNLYYLYARLIDPNNNSICTNQKATSNSRETDITIKEGEKMIILKNIEGPVNITAGTSAKYTVEVVNFGNLKEERVLIIVYNDSFGIKEEQEIIGLGIEEEKGVELEILIPANASYSQIKLLFSAEYNYRNETGRYYESLGTPRELLVQIIGNEAQVAKAAGTLAQTNETTQNPNQANQTTTLEEEMPEELELEKIKSAFPYLKSTLITILAIVIIMVTTFLILKYKKKEYIESSHTSSGIEAKRYIEEINKSTSSIPQDKPS